MKVYVVNAYDISNMEVFKNYPPRVGPLLAKHGAKVLAMELNPKALEGSPKTMNAIIDAKFGRMIIAIKNRRTYQVLCRHFVAFL